MLDVETFGETIVDSVATGAHLSALFGQPVGDQLRLRAVLSDDHPPPDVARISAARSNDRQANRADMHPNYGRHQLAPYFGTKRLTNQAGSR